MVLSLPCHSLIRVFIWPLSCNFWFCSLSVLLHFFSWFYYLHCMRIIWLMSYCYLLYVAIIRFCLLSGHYFVIIWSLSVSVRFWSLYCQSLILFILWSLFGHDLSWDAYFIILLLLLFSFVVIILSLFENVHYLVILWSLFCHYLVIIWLCSLSGHYLVIVRFCSISGHYFVTCLSLCFNYIVLSLFLLFSWFVFALYCHYLNFHYIIIICWFSLSGPWN